VAAAAPQAGDLTAKSALGNVGKLIELRHRSPARIRQGGSISGAPALGAKPWHEVQSTALAIRDQSLRLRAVLQNGANQSLYFRRHLPSYRTAVVSLTHLFQASFELFRQRFWILDQPRAVQLRHDESVSVRRVVCIWDWAAALGGRRRFIEFFSTCSTFLIRQLGHGDHALSDRLTLIRRLTRRKSRPAAF
jgi:hypothetical protein